MIWLNLIPKWAIVAAIALFAAMFTSQKIKTHNLTSELSHANETIANLKAGISSAAASAAIQSKEFAEQARAAEQDRTKREKTLVADADSARRALAGLRESVSKAGSGYGLRAGKTTIGTGLDSATAYDDLFLVSSRYVDLSEKCDRHVNDLQTLIAAWPKP